MATIYLSSTYADLGAFRSAVLSAMRRMGHHVHCMEDYGAADERPIDRCLADVDKSDIYVGIIAWRYGYRPPERNPSACSITELEYRRAIEKGKPCLVFLLAESQPWPPILIDRNDDAARLGAFRALLCTRHLVGFFTSDSDLADQVATAVRTCIAQRSNYTSGAATQYHADTASPTSPKTPHTIGVQRSFQGHTDALECVTISSSGSKAASGGWDSTIRIWDLRTGKMLWRLEGHTGTVSHPGIVYKVAFTTDERQLISCGHDGTVRVWETSTGRQERCLTGHEGAVTALALNDHILVTAGVDRTLRIWNLHTCREVQVLRGSRGPIHGLGISSDGRIAVSGGRESTLRLWDLENAVELQRFTKPTNPLLSVDLANDGTLALTGDTEGRIFLWEVRTGFQVRSFDGHAKAVRQAILSRDLHRMISVSNDGTMRFWDLGAGKELARFDEHGCPVPAVAMSADATTAITGAADKVVRTWRLPT